MPRIIHTDYYSPILGRSIKVEVTGHYGYPIIMFPTSCGSYTQNADFHLNQSVSHFTDSGKIKLYNLETIDELSFYADWLSPYERVKNYELYVQFLIQEFIPHIQSTHNTHRVAVAGCSFGAYHAANFALRFPDVVSHLIAMSGAFSIRNFMDGKNVDLAYFNSPEEFMSNEESWKFNHMRIILSTSDQDVCLGKNLNMSKILQQKDIDHWYDEKKWISHDWPLWRMVFPEFIGSFFY